MKILIATPCAQGQVRYEYALSLLTEAFMHPDRLRNTEHYDIGLRLNAGYSGLARDRGMLASSALKSGVDKILFIDADMAWKWSDIKALVDSDKDIISGLTPIKQYPLKLNPTPMPDDVAIFKPYGNKVTPASLDPWSKKYDGAKELEVLVTGTAFLCIDRKVLEKMATVCEPFIFNDPENGGILQCYDFFASGCVDNIYLGEDWGFCVQARRAGFKIHVNKDVLLTHIGDHAYRVDDEIKTPESVL